jgi:hypothetical protein
MPTLFGPAGRPPPAGSSDVLRAGTVAGLGPGTAQDTHARAGVLIGSVLAASAASVLLRVRSHRTTSRSRAGRGRRHRPDA